MSLSSDSRTLFQSNAAQETGERRASRAAQLSTFTAGSGWPITLAGVGVPAGHTPSGPLNLPLDPTRGAALDGGRFKALSIHSAPRDVIAVAEASGIIRAVHAVSGASLATYPAATGPVAAVLPLGHGRALMVTSGWDKALRFFAFDPPVDEAFAPPPRSQSLVSIPPPPAAPAAKVALVRPVMVLPDVSADLVKAVAWDPATHAVIVSGSDATVRVYDAVPLVAAMAALDGPSWRVLAQPVSGPSVPPTIHAEIMAALPQPTSVAAERSHTRPILSLLVAPSARPRIKCAQRSTFFAGDSMGRIVEYTLSRTDDKLELVLRRELRGHETAVNALAIGIVPVEAPRPTGTNNEAASDVDEDEVPIRILWSASGDKTVRGWILDSLPVGTKSGPWGGNGAGQDRTSKATPVRSKDAPLYASYVLPVPDTGKAVYPLWNSDDRISVITGGADEDLRVWSVPAPGPSQLDTETSSKWLRRAVAAHWHEITGLIGWNWNEVPYVVSSGLDGTVRRWNVQELFVAAPATEPTEAIPAQEEPMPPGTGMTAEEEAELEALMADN